ncbi:MAG: hypothetical protein R3C17_14715 [Planctomycetaceae bacterium]
MAKRGSSRKSGIVVAKEIRALIEANNDIRGPEVMLALREKFPRETFNDKSCQVSYANIRSQMGLSRTLKRKPIVAKGKRGRPVGRPAGPWRQASASAADMTVHLGILQAAKSLLEHCQGDATIAIQALKQLASLQME